MFGNNVYDPQSGYAKYIDLNSFADYLICNEFAWNGDGFAKSMFFYKDRDSKNNKLFAGPVRDFDWALKKMPWINVSIDVWSYITNVCNNLQATLPWHSVLMQDSTFRNIVRCRYNEFRQNILAQASINQWIDQTVATLNEAQLRHYTKWPTWGQSMGTPEQMPYSTSMQAELDTLKAMIGRRLQWMDLHLPGVCINTTASSGVTKYANGIVIYPNPATDQIQIQSESPMQTIRIVDVTGKLIYSSTVGSNPYHVLLPLPDQLHPGMYILCVDQPHQTSYHKLKIN